MIHTAVDFLLFTKYCVIARYAARWETFDNVWRIQSSRGTYSQRTVCPKRFDKFQVVAELASGSIGHDGPTQGINRVTSA